MHEYHPHRKSVLAICKSGRTQKLVARENKRTSRLWALGLDFRKFFGLLMTFTYPNFFFLSGSLKFLFVSICNFEKFKGIEKWKEYPMNTQIPLT